MGSPESPCLERGGRQLRAVVGSLAAVRQSECSSQRARRGQGACSIASGCFCCTGTVVQAGAGWCGWRGGGPVGARGRPRGPHKARLPAGDYDRATVEIRGKLLKVRIVKTPFVRNGKIKIDIEG